MRAGRAGFTAAWVIVGLLYLSALNPFYLPDTHDNILYQEAARSLASGEGFQYSGKLVTDWPPGFPFVLSLPHVLGVHSIVVSKVIVMAFAVLALLLAYRLLVREDRPMAGWTCLAIALAPTSFQMGTRILSEWPYMAWSFLFLILLGRLNDDRRTSGVAVLAGLALGASVLTRYAGVFLGAAVLAQAISNLRARRDLPLFQRVLPEALVASTGALVLLAWSVYLGWAVSRGADVWTQNHLDAVTHGSFHPWVVMASASNLFFMTQSLLGRLGPVSVVAAGAVVVVFAWGLARRVRRGGIRPSDWYALALLVFLSMYEEPNIPVMTRYILPLAPLLLSWFFEGIERIASLAGIARRAQRRLPVGVVLAAWLAALAMVDGHLVTLGKPGGGHAGLSPAASPTPETFYRGYWLDLHGACRFIEARQEEGLVLELPNYTRYLRTFCHRDVLETSEGVILEPERIGEAAFAVTADDGTQTVSLLEGHGFGPIARFGSVKVYGRIVIEGESVPLPRR